MYKLEWNFLKKKKIIIIIIIMFSIWFSMAKMHHPVYRPGPFCAAVQF
jgi:fumarate reductase subunit D